MYKSFLSVGFLTIVSRIVGFWREMLIAHHLGAGALTDAIKISMKIPSLFRRIFAEGAFNASFVPMFAQFLAKSDDKKDALSFAEEILSWLCILLCVMVLFVELAMPWLFKIACPGFDQERLYYAIEFTRITFPFILFISLTAFYSGILNSLDRFVFVASSPVVGNIFIVGFVFVTTILNQNPAFNMVIAVLGCGILQFIWVWIPCYRSGYGLKLRLPTLTPRVKDFFQKVGPAAFGAGVVQINILIDMMIASTLPKGYISYLDFAERLSQLPLSVIGTAISTVLLPILSKNLSSSDHPKDMTYLQNQAIEFAMLLSLPCMCGLIVWSVPIVGLVYQSGKFDAEATFKTAAALSAFASGLPAYILIKIFSTTFFSNKDTKTPVKSAIFCVFLNVTLNFILIQFYDHVGLALATSISAWVNAVILYVILKKKSLFSFSKDLQQFFIKVMISILLGLPVLIYSKNFLASYLIYTGVLKIFVLICAIVVGFLIFGVTTYATGAFNLQQFKHRFKTINQES